NDGDLCTQVDSCQSGTCAGGSPVVCVAPDACHDPGTCDPTSGNCENAPEKPDSTPCDDGNACTQVDSCLAGTCTGATPVICPVADACHEPGTCNVQTGICEAGAPKADGTQCDDGNACTQVDSCQSGACTGTSPVICAAADDCHDPGICDEATGVCGAGPEKPDGTQCDDGNACTQVDSCLAGTCTGTSPVICAAADACHEPGTCDEATGVCGAGPEKPDGTQCDDGNACTQVDTCQSGTCAGGSPIVCVAPDACHETGTCDPTSGNCENAPEKPDSTPCDDGNACTQVDSCLAGTCTGTSPVICSAADACHEPGTCNAQTGICEAGAAKPDGTQCDDGNACTQVDSCQAGACQAGPPADLDGDGHVDAQCGGTDCLDTNPSVWHSPFEVTNLGANPGNPANFFWDSQNIQAGPGTVFDLSSGKLTDLHGLGFSLSTCLQGAGGNSYADTRPDPPVGEGYWYLTRPTNSCGVGTFGSSERDSGITVCTPGQGKATYESPSVGFLVRSRSGR
ncbi:MAG: hypothetical protein L0170_14870, partial [Acidobacteria bacterium]|nr:hypothetical protein [Acidobacteriota bacterium]